MFRIVTSRSYIAVLNQEFNDCLFSVLEKQFKTGDLKRNGVGLKKALNRNKLRIFYDKDTLTLSIQSRNRHLKSYFNIHKKNDEYFYSVSDEL